MDTLAMNTFKRHRFPPDIISYAVWLYYRFNLSHRDIEDLLAERGIFVSYESVRLWCIKFGLIFAGRLKRKYQGYGDTFYIDEVFVKIDASSTTCGEPSTRTVRWLMCFFRLVGTETRRSDFSSACAHRIAASPGRSLPINFGVTVSLTEK
jgi:hypothetical protein